MKCFDVIHTFESMFRYIGEVEKQPELMEKAYRLGQKLVESVKI